MTHMSTATKVYPYRPSLVKDDIKVVWRQAQQLAAKDGGEVVDKFGRTGRLWLGAVNPLVIAQYEKRLSTDDLTLGEFKRLCNRYGRDSKNLVCLEASGRLNEWWVANHWNPEVLGKEASSQTTQDLANWEKGILDYLDEQKYRRGGVPKNELTVQGLKLPESHTERVMKACHCLRSQGKVDFHTDNHIIGIGCVRFKSRVGKGKSAVPAATPTPLLLTPEDLKVFEKILKYFKPNS